MHLRARVRAALRGLRRRDLHDPNFVGFDKYRRAGAYHWRELTSNPQYRAKIEEIVKHVEPTSLVVDLGCGDGAYMSVVANVCNRVVGVDADYDAIALARRTLRRAGITNAACFQMTLAGATIETLQLGTPADLVYSMDVIEHLPAPSELLDTAAGLARKDGLIVIGTPLFLNDDLVSPHHVKEFRVEEINALLSSHFLLIEELLLDDRRLDGHVHDSSFYLAICQPRDRD